MKLLKTRIALAVGLLSAGSFASAATDTTTFGVTATVSDSCSVSATDLGFGPIDPLAGTATETTTTVSVTCSNGTDYTVGLSAGVNGASVTERQMTDGTMDDNRLNYFLYTENTRTTNWDDAGGTNVVAGTGSGNEQDLPVYASVPHQQTAVVGSYTDTITVTVTY